MKNHIKRLVTLMLVIVMVVTAIPLGGFVTQASAKEYSVGDIIEFGSYPQSKITNKNLIADLDALPKEWISYDYYVGTGSGDGEMKPSDFMKYADVTLDGEKYRAVTFSHYRPKSTSATSSAESYQRQYGYTPNKIYYFQFEPIEWRVLDPEQGLVMSEMIIDSQPYNNTRYDVGTWNAYQDKTCTVYANDYAESSIREWLNETFYNTAFTEFEKDRILLSELDNSAYRDIDGKYEQKFERQNTIDKIFFLSARDLVNTAYGFTGLSTRDSKARRGKGTEYAKCQGLWVDTADPYYGNVLKGCGDWWSRSANVWMPLDESYSYETDDVSFVYYEGSVLDSSTVTDTTTGVRPAFKLKHISDFNIYNLGEETYEFNNFTGDDCKVCKTGGHCFGMSVTSSGYYMGLLQKNFEPDNDKALYELENTPAVRKNICFYHGIQGSIIDEAIVAGATAYENEDGYVWDIQTDWNQVVDYVKSHEYDGKGSLVIGYEKEYDDGPKGHAVNFLRYEVVDGQKRIYVCDSNCPTKETYFYQDDKGNVKQAVKATFSGNIDCIYLISVPDYFTNVKIATDENVKRYFRGAVFADELIQIDGAERFLMYGDYGEGSYYVYELPEDMTNVKITPLADNASFKYMDKEYSFGGVNEDTYAELTFETNEEKEFDYTVSFHCPHPDEGKDGICDLCGIKYLTCYGQTNAKGDSLRFITCVDSLNYEEVGFEITHGDKTVTKSSKTVYSSILAGGKKYTASQITGDEDMKYILTFTITGLEELQDAEFEVIPYVVKLDGTKEYGKEKTFCVANMLK